MGDCYFCQKLALPYFDAEPLIIQAKRLPNDVLAMVAQLRGGWSYAEAINVCTSCRPLVDRRDFFALLQRVGVYYIGKYGPNARLDMFSWGLFPLLLFAALDKRKLVRLPDDAPSPWKTSLRAFANAKLEMLRTKRGSSFPVRMFSNGVGIHAELLPEALRLITIYSTRPGRKLASKALDDVLRHADQDRTAIVLCAFPIERDDGMQLDREQLVSWYKRRDFELWDPPPSLRTGVKYDGVWMRRDPSR